MPVCAGMLAEARALKIDAATVIDQGCREAQEDAVLAAFGDGAAAGLHNLLDDSFSRGAIGAFASRGAAQIVNDDSGTLCGEGVGLTPTNAASCTGHDRDATF